MKGLYYNVLTQGLPTYVLHICESIGCAMESLFSNCELA